MEPESRDRLRRELASPRSFGNTINDRAVDGDGDNEDAVEAALTDRLWAVVMGRTNDGTPIEFRENWKTLVQDGRKHNRDVMAERAAESRNRKLRGRDEDEDPDPDGDLDDDTDDGSGNSRSSSSTSTSSSASSTTPPPPPPPPPPTTKTITSTSTSDSATPTKVPDLSAISSSVPTASTSMTSTESTTSSSSTTLQTSSSRRLPSDTTSTFSAAAATADRSTTTVTSAASSSATSAADTGPTPIPGKDPNFNRASKEAMVVTGLGVTAIILSIILIIAFKRRKQLLAAYRRYKERRARGEDGRGSSFISNPIMAPDSGPQGDGRMVGVSNPISWNAEKTFAKSDANLLYAPKPKRGTLSRIKELLAAPLTSNPITRSFQVGTTNKKASWLGEVERDAGRPTPNEKDPEMFSMDDDRTKSTGLLYFDGNTRVHPVASQMTRGPGSIRTASSEAVDPARVVIEGDYRESAVGSSLSFPDPPARTLQKDKSFFSWSSGPETNQDPTTPKTPRTPRGYGYRDTIMTATTEATEPNRHRSVRSWVINQQLQKERKEDRQRDKEAARLEAATQEPLPTAVQNLAGFRFTSMSSKGGSVNGDPISPRSSVSPRSTMQGRPVPAATVASSSYSGTNSRSFSRPSFIQPIPTTSSYYSSDMNSYPFPPGTDIPPVPALTPQITGPGLAAISSRDFINTPPIPGTPAPSRAVTRSPSINRSLTSEIASVERAVGVARADVMANPFVDPEQPNPNPFADPQATSNTIDQPLPPLTHTPVSGVRPPPISKRKTVEFDEDLNEIRTMTTLSSSYNSSILNPPTGHLSSNPSRSASVPNIIRTPSIAATEQTAANGTAVASNTDVEEGTSYRDSRTTASVFRAHPGSRWDVWNKRGFGDGAVRKLL